MTNIMVHDTEEELIQTFKKMLETLCEKYNTTTTDIISNDEINLEAPADIAEEIAKVVYDCMVKAGAIFCTRCKLDADISRNDAGSLPDHWIH